MSHRKYISLVYLYFNSMEWNGLLLARYHDLCSSGALLNDHYQIQVLVSRAKYVLDTIDRRLSKSLDLPIILTRKNILVYIRA